MYLPNIHIRNFSCAKYRFSVHNRSLSGSSHLTTYLLKSAYYRLFVWIIELYKHKITAITHQVFFLETWQTSNVELLIPAIKFLNHFVVVRWWFKHFFLIVKFEKQKCHIADTSILHTFKVVRTYKCFISKYCYFPIME